MLQCKTLTCCFEQPSYNAFFRTCCCTKVVVSGHLEQSIEKAAYCLQWNLINVYKLTWWRCFIVVMQVPQHCRCWAPCMCHLLWVCDLSCISWLMHTFFPCQASSFVHLYLKCIARICRSDILKHFASSPVLHGVCNHINRIIMAILTTWPMFWLGRDSCTCEAYYTVLLTLSALVLLPVKIIDDTRFLAPTRCVLARVFL